MKLWLKFADLMKHPITTHFAERFSDKQESQLDDWWARFQAMTSLCATVEPEEDIFVEQFGGEWSISTGLIHFYELTEAGDTIPWTLTIDLGASAYYRFICLDSHDVRRYNGSDDEPFHEELLTMLARTIWRPINWEKALIN